MLNPNSLHVAVSNTVTLSLSFGDANALSNKLIINFPAIAVADEIKRLKPESEIIFVGTKSKIEGRVIPKLGYGFKSIWIKGFARKFNLENLLFPVKLFVSLVQSLIISFRFKPRVAIGSGGYESGFIGAVQRRSRYVHEEYHITADSM